VPKRSPMTSASPSHMPGIMIRVAPSGTSGRRAIHSVVISAATVIFMTATSYSKGSSARPSVPCRAGAASLPVTNRNRSAMRASGRCPLGLAEDELVRRALERAVGAGPPQHGVLDLARHREVLVGDAAGRVILELDPELAPRHREVGVVVGRLADEADGVDHHQCRGPAVGVVLAPQPAVLEVPAVEAVLLDLGLDLLVAVRLLLHGHG